MGDKFIKFCTLERSLIGLSLFRILTGLGVLYWYLIHYYQRHYLWGPDGVLPIALWLETPTFSLYALDSSITYFEVIFHLGILTTVAWTIGWKTRFTGILALVFRYSLYTRNTLIANGGDNLSVLVMIYLLLAQTGTIFSIDTWPGGSLTPGQSLSSLRKYILGAIHNAALLAVVLQLCVIYTIAGLHKVTGPMWQSGTALYYIMRVQEFSSPYSHLVYRNEYLLVILAYATVYFQLGFALAILLNRYTRYLWLLGGIAFHLGIGVFMGLTTFAWLMIAVYPILITDGEYRWAFTRLKQGFKQERFKDALPRIRLLIPQRKEARNVSNSILE
jgi:hypothetical protein